MACTWSVRVLQQSLCRRWFHGFSLSTVQACLPSTQDMRMHYALNLSKFCGSRSICHDGDGRGAFGKHFPQSPAFLKMLSVQYRLRSKKSRRASTDSGEYESDDSSEDEEIEKSKDFKVLKGNVSSTRMDAVLKFALGMSRNKVDNAFYSSSIYVNGEKLIKKSQTLTVEDEIDIVLGQNTLNPAFLDVTRVEVLDIHRAHGDSDKLTLKVRRFKRLTIDNYPSPWRPVASES